MNIGYRCEEREIERSKVMLEKHSEDGYQYFRAYFEGVVHKKGRWKGHRKGQPVKWRRAAFPMIDDGIDKRDIQEFWERKPVRFARMNNCVGCFHRSSILLRMMADMHPNKMNWFAEQESVKKIDGKTRYRTWKANFEYSKIFQQELITDLLDTDIEAEGCTSGWCGV